MGLVLTLQDGEFTPIVLPVERLGDLVVLKTYLAVAVYKMFPQRIRKLPLPLGKFLTKPDNRILDLGLEPIILVSKLPPIQIFGIRTIHWRGSFDHGCPVLSNFIGALTFSEAFHGTQKRLQLDGETINVRIPPGAKPGSRIRIKGKGSISPFSQQRGDLYLTIDLQPHPLFKFEGDNIVCEVPITPEEAALGADIKIPTPDGSVTMKIPSVVDSGQSLRLRGKGWQNPKGKRSDQIVKLKIVTPKELTPQERECYEKLRQASSFNPRRSIEEVRL